MSSTPPNWPLPAQPINNVSARPSTSSSHNRNTSADKRLSAIAEDRATAPSRSSAPSTAIPIPSSPPSATRGTFGRAWRDKPPHASSDTLPPQYTLWDVTGPKGEKLHDLRNNKYVSRRGGWKRLLCVILCLVGVAVGLGVGLGIGLAKNNNYSDDETPPAATPTNSFPVGNFTFAGSLASVSTGCTSNPETFLCWPYTTYATSPSNSNVTFNWAVTNSSSQLSVSSSDNPFAISFSNASLTLHDAGTQQERYSFSVQLDKYVIPTAPLDNSGALSACWFNGTTLAGNLWLQRKADDPAADAVSDGSGWPKWGFAFDANQTIGGGTDVPECFQQTTNGNLGARITTGLTPQSENEQCGCYWRNYDL